MAATRLPAQAPRVRSCRNPRVIHAACAFVPAAGFARVVGDIAALLRDEGAGKAGRWPRPWPACRKKQAAVTTGLADHARPSPRDGFKAYTRSPWGPAVLPPSSARRTRVVAKLGISTGMPGPRDFTVASEPFVGARDPRCDPIRPPHPAPDVHDDREAPPLWDGICGSNHNF
jgi:hypothetical protein